MLPTMTFLRRAGFSWLLKAHTALVEGMPKLLDNPKRLDLYWRAGMVVALVGSLAGASTAVMCLRWIENHDFSQQPAGMGPLMLAGSFSIIVVTIVVLVTFLQTCCKPSDVYSREERILLGMERSQPLTRLEGWIAVHMMAPDKQRQHRAWLLNQCLPSAPPPAPKTRL